MKRPINSINHPSLIAGEDIPEANLALTINPDDGKIILADLHQCILYIIGFSLYPTKVGEPIIVNTGLITFNSFTMDPGGYYFLGQGGGLLNQSEFNEYADKSVKDQFDIYMYRLGIAVSEKVLYFDPHFPDTSL
jgi:hypothetical protein